MSETLYYQPILGRQLTVTSSDDPTLIGRFGLVVGETMNTIKIAESEGFSTLSKAVVKIHIEGNILEGNRMNVRPEDRINRRVATRSE